MDPNLIHVDWERTFEALTMVVILSFVVERFLAIFFESDPFIRHVDRKGVKEAIALAASVGVCAYWKFDAVGMILLTADTTLAGYVVTGALIAGGSKASLKVFHDVLNIRSSSMNLRHDIRAEAAADRALAAQEEAAKAQSTVEREKLALEAERLAKVAQVSAGRARDCYRQKISGSGLEGCHRGSRGSLGSARSGRVMPMWRIVPVACVGWFALSAVAGADYLEVRRNSTIKAEPKGAAEILARPDVGLHLILVSNDQASGYYEIEIPEELHAAKPTGWIYRSLVRRFPGQPPAAETESASELTAEEIALIEATSITWPARNNTDAKPHVVFGQPKYKDHDDEHNLLITYSGFRVYWDDQVLGPRWTAIKLTDDMVDKNSTVEIESSFSVDPAIAAAGLQSTKHSDYNNPPGSRAWARGHIVQFDDARGWGSTSGKESFFTSNIAPQLQQHNGGRWLAMEKLCSEFARDYEIVWVFSGPIYPANPKPFATGRKVPKPIAFYKIVVSPGEGNKVDLLAFRMPHKRIAKTVQLPTFLTTVDAIEKATGIDFLHELTDSVEEPLERVKWSLWPDLDNS
jgi:endonuclease G